MSMIQDLDGARAEVLAVKSEFEAFKAEAGKTAGEMAEQIRVEVEAHKADVATLTAQMDQAVKDLAAAREQVVTLQASVGVVNGERDALASKLAKAEKALENPAFADAAMKGRAEGVAEGGEVSVAGKTPTWGEFNKITDPAARTEFWNKNEAKLRAEMAAASRG